MPDHHESTTADDELALSQRLVIEIKKLIGGRTDAEAVALLVCINENMALAAALRAERAATEHIKVLH